MGGPVSAAGSDGYLFLRAECGRVILRVGEFFRGKDAKKQAGACLTKLLRERDLGVFVEPARMRLDEFLNKWLETTARPRVRPRTFESYAGLVRLHVGPELGTRPLAAITPLEVQALYAKMGEQGPAPRTVRYVYSVLRSALEQAVRWRMLPQNPARHVDLPRQQRREMRALSADEALRFLEAAEGTRHGVLFELLLATGLWPGEALALRWTDIDLEVGCTSGGP